MKIKLVVSLLLAFLAFIFIIQNTHPVQVNFLAWSVEMSIVVMLMVMLGAGLIIGWVMCSYLRFIRSRRTGGKKDDLSAKGRSVQGGNFVDRQGGRAGHE